MTDYNEATAGLPRSLFIAMNTLINDPMWRMPQAKAATGLSRATIYRRIASGDFPKPQQLSKNAIGWPMSVILAWRAALV